MKRLFTILAVVLLTATMWAQNPPQKMSYQAVIRNSSNALVSTSPVGMQISILLGSETGTPVYVETQTPTTNTNGLATIEIGGGTPVTGTFAGIDWSAGPYFIKTETDPLGGTVYTITGTSQLLSVPYALYSKTAGGHYVGELYGGGIVVAVWKVAGIEKGLIASLNDMKTYTMAWSGNTTTLIGATAQSLIDGQTNTTAIIGQNSTAYKAATVCDDYDCDGFSDWYLPSAWELNQCYNAVFVVNTILGATDGFQLAEYWSSTEKIYNAEFPDDYCAWYKDFSTGIMSHSGKSGLLRVRAVRRF
jgi:hypothetical protein